MKTVTFRFSGNIGKYKWKRGEPVQMDEQTLSQMNPMAYRIRPETPQRTTMQVPEQKPVKREIKRNGSWWTLYENGKKVKSARTKEELQ